MGSQSTLAIVSALPLWKVLFPADQLTLWQLCPGLSIGVNAVFYFSLVDFFTFNYMPLLGECTHGCRCRLRPKEDIGSSGAGVTGSGELPNVAVEN